MSAVARPRSADRVERSKGHNVLTPPRDGRAAAAAAAAARSRALGRVRNPGFARGRPAQPLAQRLFIVQSLVLRASECRARRPRARVYRRSCLGGAGVIAEGRSRRV